MVVLDLETTGLSPVYDEITEISAVKVVNGKVVDRYATLVNPKRKIPEVVVELTGISDDMVKDAPVIEDVLPELKTYALDKLEAVLEIPLSNHHRAVDDAEAMMEIYCYLLQILEKKGVRVWEEVNETGRKNLREMIEKSVRNKKDGKYRIPKSILQQHREGLLIGSGANLGELYHAVVKCKAQITVVADYYVEISCHEDTWRSSLNSKELWCTKDV